VPRGIQNLKDINERRKVVRKTNRFFRRVDLIVGVTAPMNSFDGCWELPLRRATGRGLRRAVTEKEVVEPYRFYR
jgi:hypothetical protein